jgi:molecular chaperone HtpG
MPDAVQAQANSSQKETRAFQTEVKQLLQLMIHSLYSNREIFLRELISNASDAVDKLRYEAISNTGLLGAGDDAQDALRVELYVDRNENTLTIRDTGIGMNRDEVIANLGTIAKSGTREFFSKLTGDQQKDANLIGQFGVGFYSAFIVADEVTVTTRRAGSDASEGVVWVSTGDGEFSIEQTNVDSRGTTIVLKLKEDAKEFAEPWKLKSLVRKYSDHISIPIQMLAEPEMDEEGKPIIEADPKLETVNRASALWTRSKSDITADEYNEFYKHISHDWQPPLAHTHSKVEGTQEYTLLLYLPDHAPFDMYQQEGSHGVKLYVKRVFIMDEAKELMPRYLRFVKGVVDSNNLPLNVSREILQESKTVDAIRAGATKKVLSLLADVAENEKEKYRKFWNEFGRVLKEGLGEDTKNQKDLAKLCRYASTTSGGEEQTVSLADYVSRMKLGQDAIYYVSADSYKAAASSPHLEVFRKKGVEVLLMGDTVDAWAMSYITEFDGKTLQNVAKGGLTAEELDGATDSEAAEVEKKKAEATEEVFKPLLEKMKTVLGEKVKAVRTTARLTDSPACLVVEAHELSANLERMLKAAGQKTFGGAPTLEINPDHALVVRMKDSLEGAAIEDWIHLIHEQAQLAEGAQLEDPAAFVSRMNRLLV